MNLLTDQQKKAVVREYRIRLAAVALFMLAFLFASFAVLLVPVAVYVGVARENLQRELTRLDQRLEETGANRAEAFLEELRATAREAKRFLSPVSFGETIARLESVRTSQVSLRAFSLQEARGETASVRVQLEGTAATRADLVAYLDALRALSGVTSADIPLESFAKRVMVPFTVSVLLEPNAQENDSP